MKEILRLLKKQGCDIEGVRERFLNDHEFYLECLIKVLNDQSFEELKRALEERRTEDAFHYAHTLKGLLANMGLTPLVKKIGFIVEALRSGENVEMLNDCNELLMEVKKYRNLIERESRA